MTETPAADETPKPQGGTYLNKLPDGWYYQINLMGPDHKSVEIRPNFDDLTHLNPTSHRIAMRPSSAPEEQRHMKTGTLSDAVKVGVKAARTLQELSDQENKVAETRAKLLSTLDADSLEAAAALSESIDPPADVKSADE